ncbi:C4-dicarboxylate-binding protein DctP [Breoghania corrubedonensis]|uniref:C4-dicarboxylate-binding protein DctP n=1 Tax=Breoghania corrubedonensis TaxID=665038 RepID=A0A2T5VF22_9HYPH|nr:TRAP transporter substrate-binding protein DctP [Breoghania corrubedonensis]PTW62340.1 C4-dicarboxylate-binding protein DctP [Breoghania corrubedonensis]
MTFARLALAGATALALSLPLVATSAFAQKTTLRVTLQLPLKAHLGQNLLVFKDEVEKISGGDIAVEIYDSAQLYKDNEVPQAVGSGAIEMGVASLTRYVGDVPAVDIFYTPFTFNSEELVHKATAPGSPVRQPLDDAILKTGSRVLWWQAYGGCVLLSKGAPIATPADLKDKKVRVFGKTLGRWIKAAGGAPTLISGSEQYLAYQRGTVDIGMTGISGVKSRRLWEVMDTITATNNADIEFIVVINEKFWQGLPEQHREWIRQAALFAEKDVRDAMSEIERAAFAEATRNGMTVYNPTPEDLEAWKAAAQPVFDDYLAGSGDLGKQVYDAALALHQ